MLDDRLDLNLMVSRIEITQIKRDVCIQFRTIWLRALVTKIYNFVLERDLLQFIEYKAWKITQLGKFMSL